MEFIFEFLHTFQPSHARKLETEVILAAFNNIILPFLAPNQHCQREIPLDILSVKLMGNTFTSSPELMPIFQGLAPGTHWGSSSEPQPRLLHRKILSTEHYGLSSTRLFSVQVIVRQARSRIMPRHFLHDSVESNGKRVIKFKRH